MDQGKVRGRGGRESNRRMAVDQITTKSGVEVGAQVPTRHGSRPGAEEDGEVSKVNERTKLRWNKSQRWSEGWEMGINIKYSEFSCYFTCSEVVKIAT